MVKRSFREGRASQQKDLHVQKRGGVTINGVLMKGWVLERDYGGKGCRAGQGRGQVGP